MEISGIEATRNLARNSMYWGFLFIILVGSMFHFVFELLGRNVVIGIFAPVNESVWEHLKMTFLPTIAWFTISYFAIKSHGSISATRWLLTCSTSLLISVLFIIVFYYTYTGAFGIHSILLDVSSMFLSVASGLTMSWHVYQYSKMNAASRVFAFLVPILLLAAFAVFTFLPPHIPLFKDSPTGSYGI
jgi:uncharacterized membrane protein YhdT